MSKQEKKAIRGADVAREAGVSQSAVSLVLSGRPDTRISEETRLRVLETVERLGYRRNAAARALVTGRSGRIGVVPAHPNAFVNRDFYYGDLLGGIMGGVVERDWNVLLHSANYRDWKALYEDVTNGNVDGVIVIGRPASDALSLALCESGLPTVFISTYPETIPCYAVDCDNVRGGYLAAKHLLERGHRSLVNLYTDQKFAFVRERQAGMRNAVESAGLSPEAITFLATPLLETSAATEWTRELLARIEALTPKPTALITIDEWHAVKLAESLPKLGRTLPGDFALVSFNSTESSVLSRPPLTSIRQPLAEIGTVATQTLLRLIAGEKIAPEVQRLSVSLDVREST